jgi:hypothetical protein
VFLTPEVRLWVLESGPPGSTRERQVIIPPRPFCSSTAHAIFSILRLLQKVILNPVPAILGWSSSLSMLSVRGIRSWRSANASPLAVAGSVSIPHPEVRHLPQSISSEYGDAGKTNVCRRPRPIARTYRDLEFLPLLVCLTFHAVTKSPIISVLPSRPAQTSFQAASKSCALPW